MRQENFITLQKYNAVITHTSVISKILRLMVLFVCFLKCLPETWEFNP